MDLGILFIGGDLTVTDQAIIAQQSERSGFKSLYMAEAYRSAWVPMTVMAAATTTIRLGSYIINAYGHSPLMTALSAIDFNEFSKGRLVLGVGGGNHQINEKWHGIPHERVLTKMREYVEMLKLVSHSQIGDHVTYEGQIHSIDWTAVTEVTEKPFPVYLAAVFPRMMRVAAQVADGIAAGATVSAEYLQKKIKPKAAEYAAIVNRDPASIGWKVGSLIAIDQDRERARRLAREGICSLYAPLPHPYYEFTMREQGFGSIVDRLMELMPQGKLEESVKTIPDECVDRLTIAGTVEDCREQLKDYENVVDEVLLLNMSRSDSDDPKGSYAGLMKLARSYQST